MKDLNISNNYALNSFKKLSSFDGKIKAKFFPIKLNPESIFSILKFSESSPKSLFSNEKSNKNSTYQNLNLSNMMNNTSSNLSYNSHYSSISSNNNPFNFHHDSKYDNNSIDFLPDSTNTDNLNIINSRVKYSFTLLFNKLDSNNDGYISFKDISISKFNQLATQP